ncbi:hypothetical protein CBR_g673 [Chara braunii]|uniref:RNA-directed DNA polymerase n=1 Tax=Chara braunii TaxID=69332 RepID=A0A388KBV3_CHABU|nr:hypothetical protein CBR_g673 [Chara braunii]|eukprot:GBG67542.1 hypothetical protein CBR_g673 [Chara braunii]
MKRESKGQLILVDVEVFRSRVGALIDLGATRSYISRRALKKLRLRLKVQKLVDPIVSVLADNRTMRVEDYVEGVEAYFRLEKDGKVEKVLHSLTLLVQDDLPFDVVLGMDWGEAAGATLHLREHECRLPSPSGEVKTARLFHVSGVDNTLAHCCLSAPAFARLVRKEQLEEQVFVVYVRPVTEAQEKDCSTDPTIAKLLEEFKDLTESSIGVVPRPIQHRIEIEPGSRTPKGAVYRMSPRELEELRKHLDELLEKGWIRPSSSPFGAPVLFVPKKEGELRMCIDYRGLNAITVKNAEPLPRIDNLLDRGRVVLEKLREANFKINAKKCEWAKTQVLYLGHVLDGDGIKPEDSKIAAIRDWPTPRTLTELRSFLGLANYYRKFVRNFSTIAAPLRRLLKKEAIWQWDKDCTFALKKLKRALIEYPVLKVADPSLPFVVTTDASQYWIGAVLQQDDGNGYRPVELMAARMPCEKVAASTYERKLYALRQALDHWKHYVLGRHFKVYSDHETLRWLKTQAKMTPKLTRWAAEIDQFDFELKPVKGKYNVVADALSRRSDYFGAVVHYVDIGRDLQEKVRQAYAQDPIYAILVADLLGDVTRPYGELRPLPVPLRRREAIAMDITGPFLKHKTGVDRILTVVDRLTKFAMFLPCRYHAKAPELAEVLYAGWIRIKGYPKEIVCDHDTRFMSDFWLALIKRWGSSLKPSSSRHPQTDGQTERAHQTAQVLLRTLIRPDQKDWVERLPDVELAYNSSIHPAIGMSPFEFEHDSPVTSPLDTSPRTAESDDHLLFLRRMQELLVKARDQMAKTQQRMSQQANRQRLPCPFRAGDLVWVSAAEFSLEQDISRKLLPKWMGPWPIVAPAGDAPEGPSFTIQVPGYLPVYPVFHCSKLALYTPAEHDDFPERRSQDPPSIDGFQEVGDIIS